MPAQRTWFYPWVPLGLIAAIVGLGAWLVLYSPTGPQAQGGEPMLQDAIGIKKDAQTIALAVNVVREKGDALRGTLHAELVGADGKVIEHREQTVDQKSDVAGYRFEFKAPAQAPEQVQVRYRLGSKKLEQSLAKVLLSKAHETTLNAGQEFYANSPAAMRCEVHGVRSITDSVPLAGSAVEVTLKDGKKEHKLYTGKVGADGVASVAFKMPDLPSGKYKMEVVTTSTLGEEKLEREVNVKAEPKILLVTDKPLYQPGQLIHIRALALNGFDLKAAGSKKLVFEVEDSKGNKVFKKESDTSEYGVAAIDFQLASEVNQGEYRIRAILDKTQSEKTVTVKPYVLPKFKGEVKADKKFYMPKETINADLQSDYFFGKPVAGAKVKVTASTFDVAFKEFLNWEGKTDAQGHLKFEVKLPDYFVGQPLEKGNAIVKLDVKVTDTADHTETFTKTYTVSSQPIRVSLLPEAGRLVPGVENRVFVAALYPDGSPAKATIRLWQGQARPDKVDPMATLKTSDSGLAELVFTPKADQFRPGEWAQQTVEMLGGTRQVHGPKNLFDLFAEATDDKGTKATAQAALSSDPLGENVLLRLDKAIYRGGDSVKLDVRSSAGLPTVYIDVVKSGQTLLTKWYDVKDGKSLDKLDLPAELFGTLEIHAYQMLASGEIIRDSRVVYVQAANELKVKVSPDKEEYLPGKEGTIRFEVTDQTGKPAAAALGVVIVDEAVYALQDMQPGLEKVYFTLQEELLKPQAQVVFKPHDTIDNLVIQPALPAEQQQVAQALLTAVRPKAPAKWAVNPAFERRQKYEERIQTLGWALHNYAQQNKPFLEYDKDSKSWNFKKDLAKELLNAGFVAKEHLADPMGGELDLNGLGKVEKDFTPNRLAEFVTAQRFQHLHGQISNHVGNVNPFMKEGRITLPENIVEEGAKAGKYVLQDAWGQKVRLIRRDKKVNSGTGLPLYDDYELVSAGPDGKFGTEDDVKFGTPAFNRMMNHAWFAANRMKQLEERHNWRERQLERGARLRDFDRAEMMKDRAMPPVLAGGIGGGGFPKTAAGEGRPTAAPPKPDGAPHQQGGEQAGSGQAPTRMREYFPETMLWQPSLITDERGIATLPVTFADSITTWRLTASASSPGGMLGGTTTGLKVFQDFFVDLDLPVALTQNDEVSFPVAVYNYLKELQTVRLELKKEAWFDLIDGDNVRSLTLKPGEVTGIKYRIRAKKVGNFPLTVEARGTKMSDAIKRGIDVLPDGQKVEQVVTDRLNGKVKHTIVIPDNAVPDASKLIVKVYPGVFSQVLEGADGMLRLPGG